MLLSTKMSLTGAPGETKCRDNMASPRGTHVLLKMLVGSQDVLPVVK